MNTIDLIKYMKDYPYWEHFKVSAYYYFRPWKHFKLVMEGKSIADIAFENAEKKGKKDEI